MTQIETIARDELEPTKPRDWTVILHNDDYTTHDFVLGVVQKVFNKSFDESLDITMTVDQDGRCAVGHYPADIAQTKAEMVCQLAGQSGFPFLAVAEPIA